MLKITMALILNLMDHDISNMGLPHTFPVYLLISESIERNIEKR